MLKEKDYCDYETCIALKELGYKVPTSAYYMPKNSQLIFVINQFRGGAVMDCFYSNNSLPKECMGSDFIDAPTLWETQKWLREEKDTEIIVFSKGMVGSPYYFHVYFEDYADSDDKYYDSYEEALSEGIKDAIEILKENENI